MSKRYLNPHIHCSIIYNGLDMGAASTDEWMKKMSSAIKKKNILLFVTTWMDLESNMLSEINQIEKGKYCGI